MPRWTSALPPMIVAARVYHHFARTALSSLLLPPPTPELDVAAGAAPELDVAAGAAPEIIQSRRVSRMRSLMSFSALANSSLSTLLFGPTARPSASARTVVAARACAASTAT